MVAMAGMGLRCPVRVRLVDLVAAEGILSERYKQAVNALSQSLARYNTVIIELPLGDDALLGCVLDSSRAFFHHRPIPSPEANYICDPQDWNGTAGYFAEPQNLREVYDYRPGRSTDAVHGGELPPVGLSALFSALGKASRQIVDAIGFSLNLQSYCFADLLDNVPLKTGEISTSVLSLCCYGRPGTHRGHLAVTLAGTDQCHMQIFDQQEPHIDKGLLTLTKSDRPGLHIRDIQGRWLLADGDLGPQDMILYTGLALYQATAGYISPALHRADGNDPHGHLYGRCSISFKLMPRPSAILHCSAMTNAGHAVGGPFQQPVTVHDFMQRSYPADQIVTRPGAACLDFPRQSDAIKPSLKRRKQLSKGKPLAPSKRLRLEAQRVLKERVQEIADRKGIKIRFCSLKECEDQHIPGLDSPCAAIRAQIGWPPGVPFVHPHDLPNRAKQAFLEAYEPGWTEMQDGEIGLIDSRHSHSHTHALNSKSSVHCCSVMQ